MFTDPLKNLKALGLLENAVVADLGAGTGFYSLAASTIVTSGKVYAVEIDKDFLGTITTKIKEAGLKNVEVIWGNIEKIGGTKLQDSSVDAVILSNVLSQVEDKNKLLDETKRILKNTGKVLLVDWSESSVISPKIIIPKDKVLEMFQKKGFILDREIDAGEHHYGIIFSKS